MIDRTFVILAVLFVFTVAAVEGRPKRVTLEPISLAKLRQIVRGSTLVSRRDNLPEGRVISHGFSAIQGFALGVKKGALGGGSSVSSGSSGNNPSKPNYSELCFEQHKQNIINKKKYKIKKGNRNGNRNRNRNSRYYGNDDSNKESSKKWSSNDDEWNNNDSSNNGVIVVATEDEYTITNPETENDKDIVCIVIEKSDGENSSKWIFK